MSILVTLFYLCLFAIAITKFKYALFIFVAHIPIIPLMHTNGTIPFNDYFSIILLAHFVINKVRIEKNDVFRNKIVKKFLFFFVTFAVVIFLNGIRFSILREGYLASIPSHILAAVIIIFTCVNFYYIYKLILYDKYYRNIVYNSVIASAIILSLSVLFTAELSVIGITITEYSVESGRSSGLFSGGDCNGLAGFLCMVISFMLVKMNLANDKLNILNAAFLFLFVCVVFLTASRMGFLTLIGLFMYYIFFQRTSFNPKNIFYIMLILGVLLFYSDTIVNPVLERLNEGSSIRNEVASGEEGRSEIWLLYLAYMFTSNTNVILFGSEKSISLLVPHNFFINTFFLNGIVVTLLLIYAMVKSITFFVSEKLFKHIFPIASATIISCMFLVDALILYYYVLLCVLVWSYCRYNNNYEIVA